LFDQILDLVGQPPGSLVYHFIILFAVEASLAIGVGQWMRDRDGGTARLTIAVFGVFVARALVLVASLLVWQGYLPTNVLLPPIERTVDTATLLALGWAFITMDDPAILRRNFAPDTAAASALGMIIAGFVGTYYYWFFAASRGELFNGQWLDFVWSGAQVLVAAVSLIWMLARVRYVYDPFLKGIMLILLGTAAGFQLVRPDLGDVATPIRIGQIVAMPMLAAVAYRHVVEQLLHWDEFEPSRSIAPAVASPTTIPSSAPAPAAPPPDSLQETVKAPEPLPSKVKPTQPQLLDVIDAVGGLLTTLEQSEIVREAPRAVATALRADIAVLAIVDEEAQQAGVVGGYDNIAQSYLPRALLDLADHPTIVNALGRLRQMRMTSQRESRELRDLYIRLGIAHEGPAYVQPLVKGEERIGVLIVGSPYSERQLSTEERDLLDRLAPLVTAALLNVEAHESLREQLQKDIDEEAARLVSLTDDLTAKVSELNDARRQNEEMKAYIRDLHRQLEALPKQQEAARQQVESLMAEIERLRQASQESASLQEQLAAAHAEVQQLRENNERLLQQAREEKQADASRIEQLLAEQQQLRAEGERIAALEREIERLQARMPTAATAEIPGYDRQWDEARLAAQSEIVALRARLAQASISQQEVAFLQEQIALKAREVVGLQTRLTEAQAVIEALREQIASGIGGTRELGALQGRIGAQAAEIAALRAELTEARIAAEANPEAVAAQRTVDEIDRQAVAQLEAQLAERAALIDALEAKLAEKARAIGELKSHMADVETSLHNLERQFSHKSEEVAALQASLAEARAQAQEQVAAFEARARAGGESEVDWARLAALETQLAEKSQAVVVLEQQLESARQAMSALEQQLTATSDAVGSAIADARRIDSHDEVIASIAQELRTPMSSIMGYTDLLLREQIGILGSLQRKFLQRVKANTERMGALLDDLIRITALDTGRLTLEPEKVDVIYAIEEAVMNVANQYREKGLVLRLALAEGLPPLTADRDALLQMIGHLLSNAALASPVEGEVYLTVTGRRDSLPADGGAVEADCLYIAVQDSGQGIDPADFERVFARKYRADNPLIAGLGDTGVSLSLAKALVDAHGGRIWLDSTPGAGTTFHVLLPFGPSREGGA